MAFQLGEGLLPLATPLGTYLFSQVVFIFLLIPISNVFLKHALCILFFLCFLLGVAFIFTFQSVKFANVLQKELRSRPILVDMENPLHSGQNSKNFHFFLKILDLIFAETKFILRISIPNRQRDNTFVLEFCFCHLKLLYIANSHVIYQSPKFCTSF